MVTPAIIAYRHGYERSGASGRRLVEASTALLVNTERRPA
jgi:hypothetical protein